MKGEDIKREDNTKLNNEKKKVPQNIREARDEVLKAETDKLKAETDKLKAEIDKLKAETNKLQEENKKGLWAWLKKNGGKILTSIMMTLYSIFPGLNPDPGVKNPGAGRDTTQTYREKGGITELLKELQERGLDSIEEVIKVFKDQGIKWREWVREKRTGSPKTLETDDGDIPTKKI
jgi:hypothetical protein